MPGEGGEYRGAKKTSAPAALISDLAKGSKTVLAGSVPDGVDVPSSCRAGRQDSCLGIQSHLDAKAVCSREMAWTGERGVCYYLQ